MSSPIDPINYGIQSIAILWNQMYSMQNTQMQLCISKLKHEFYKT
jgi:hypothetical protein